MTPSSIDSSSSKEQLAARPLELPLDALALPLKIPLHLNHSISLLISTTIQSLFQIEHPSAKSRVAIPSTSSSQEPTIQEKPISSNFHLQTLYTLSLPYYQLCLDPHIILHPATQVLIPPMVTIKVPRRIAEAIKVPDN